MAPATKWEITIAAGHDTAERRHCRPSADWPTSRFTQSGSLRTTVSTPLHHYRILPDDRSHSLGLAIILIASIIALILLTGTAYSILSVWSRRQRRRLGLTEGTVVVSDDSWQRAPTLSSTRLGLVGRCDQILKVGHYHVPVEQKPTSRRLQPSHVLQVGALCLLVQEEYEIRPPYGLVVLAGGRQERVPFNNELEQAVLTTMSEMRRTISSGQEPGPRWKASKCKACRFRDNCWPSS